jgi:hypothetical protein
MGAAAGQVDVDQGIGLRDQPVSQGRLFRTQFEEIAQGQAQATNKTGEEEFAAGIFAEVRRIVVPSDRFGFAHNVLFWDLAGVARGQHLATLTAGYQTRQLPVGICPNRLLVGPQLAERSHGKTPSPGKS